MKKFNVKPTHAAFLVVREQMQDLLTLRVHESLLEGSYLKQNNNYIRKQLAHLEEMSTVVLLATFIGKLSLRMPNGITEGKWDDFQLEEMKKIGAALLINILVDSGEYEMISKTKQVGSPDGGRSFKTELFLVFNGVLPTKELTYGLELEPGVVYQDRVGDMRLDAKFRWYLNKLSSMAFKVSDVATEELILHGYKLSKDYNSNPKWGERRPMKKERYRGYAKFIMDEIATLDKFYLPMKYDSRSRMYYLFQLVGLRPQGHLWETLLIDAAEPKVLDKSAIKHLKHIIYVTRYGRRSLEQSELGFTQDDYTWAATINPLAVVIPVKEDYSTKEEFGAASTKAEKDFGDAILVNKAVKAAALIHDGKPCSYMFGKDLTNSGLMMAGACFKSPKMLKMANLRKLKTVHDSHSDMRIAYGLDHLTRKDMKRISNPMLHGAALITLVKNVQSALRNNGENEHTVNSIDLPFIRLANYEAFGPEVDNIFAIAEWGALAVCNTQTKLYWITPDGFKAYHRAHMAYCPVIVNAATASNKACYREAKLVYDMPLKQQSDGQSIYDKDFVASGSKHPVQVKKSGLYANLTHGMDASLLREVVDLVVDKGEVCLLKHDDYITFADRYDEIIVTGQDFFIKASEVNYYQQALEQIVAFGSNMPPLPKLSIGKGKVEASVNYLMP